MTASSEQTHALIEQAGGPALIAYRLEREVIGDADEGSQAFDWHHHLRGQFFCVESGVVHVHTEHGAWMLPPQPSQPPRASRSPVAAHR